MCHIPPPRSHSSSPTASAKSQGVNLPRPVYAREPGISRTIRKACEQSPSAIMLAVWTVGCSSFRPARFYGKARVESILAVPLLPCECLCSQALSLEAGADQWEKVVRTPSGPSCLLCMCVCVCVCSWPGGLYRGWHRGKHVFVPWRPSGLLRVQPEALP